MASTSSTFQIILSDLWEGTWWPPSLQCVNLSLVHLKWSWPITCRQLSKCNWSLYLSHTNYVLSETSCIGIISLRRTLSFRFWVILSTLIFELNIDHLIIPPHWKPFGPQKILSIVQQVRVKLPHLLNLHPFGLRRILSLESHSKVFHIPSLWISGSSVKYEILL